MEKNKKLLKVMIVVIIWFFILITAITLLIQEKNKKKVLEETAREMEKIVQTSEKLDHDVKAIMEGEGEVLAKPIENGYQGEGYRIEIREKEKQKEYIFYLEEKEVFHYQK